jgi:hypothetical protein
MKRARKEKPVPMPPKTKVLGNGKLYFVEFQPAWHGWPESLLVVRLLDGRAAALDPKLRAEIEEATPPDFDAYCEETAAVHGQRQYGVDFAKHGVFGPMYDGAKWASYMLQSLLGEVAA